MSTASGKYAKLVPHFAFYGAYHSNPVNQWVHIICVPIILATFMAMFHRWVPLDAYIPADIAALVAKYTGASFSLSTIAVVLYALYYIYLTPNWLGFSAAFLVGVAFVTGTNIAAQGAAAVQYAIYANVVGWIAQFYAHGVHEGRSPALLDNLAQALGMAPLFVYIEFLLKLGLLKDLQAAVQPEVQRRVDEFNAKKAAAARKNN